MIRKLKSLCSPRIQHAVGVPKVSLFLFLSGTLYCYSTVPVLELVVATSKPHTVVRLGMTVIESPRACDFYACFWIQKSLCRLL